MSPLCKAAYCLFHIEGRYPFRVALGDFGSFGRRNKATLWQGFQPQGAEHLRDLASSVRQALSQQDFSFDNKTFLPHITLMRGVDLSAGQLPMPYMARGPIQTV